MTQRVNKGYTYRVTLTPVDDRGETIPSSPSVSFTHRNHDDLERIVAFARESSGLDAESAASMAVGLKLLGQTMLEHRNNPLFDGLRGPLRDFITTLKSRRGDG